MKFQQVQDSEQPEDLVCGMMDRRELQQQALLKWDDGSIARPAVDISKN
jgi:hypothetical protein